ncbi:MAG: DUF218 domain-containing protein [Chlorobiales bacterium]|nr:DUF218 domain-containing protein [Chlorobiales bacterium]
MIKKGMIQRRECLLPTSRGCFFIVLIVSVLVVTVIKGIYPFLAVNDPVYGGALVVEGWMPDYGFEQAVTELKRHHYSKLYVTGGTIAQGRFLSEYGTFAELGLTIITRMGVSADSVEAVPSSKVDKDRTYASAIALKNRLQAHNAASNIHVISLGVHSRRTRLLFEKAFGDSVNVGITAIEDQDYEPDRWWTTSAGVRTVLSEAIAYTYALLFF